MKNFISNIKTCVIGTIDANNHPFSSYAPYIYDNNHFYIYISSIATHTKNMDINPHTSLFFIEDESKTENLFARKRISLQCISKKIDRESERFEEVLNLYSEKFDAKMVKMLKNMLDFNLFELSVDSGEATFGFADAYRVGGKDMNELLPREGVGHQHAK